MSGFNYHVYGFTIASDIELPGMPETDGPPDIHIRCLAPASTEFPQNSISGDMNEMRMEIGRIGLFMIRQGREVTFEPSPNTDWNWIRLYLLGLILGILLYQRGFLVLHASCVSIQGHACLFAGQVGAGKSTFASYLLKAGGRLLADDITAIKMVDGAPIVQPGFPMIRLTPEIAECTIGNSEPGVTTQIAKLGKKIYLANSYFDSECMPLKAFYLLQFGEERKFEKIPAQQALSHCMPHLYVNSLTPQKQAPLFLKLAAMLKQIEVYHFHRVHGFDNIPGDCSALMRHVVPE